MLGTPLRAGGGTRGHASTYVKVHVTIDVFVTCCTTVLLAQFPLGMSYLSNTLLPLLHSLSDLTKEAAV